MKQNPRLAFVLSLLFVVPVVLSACAVTKPPSDQAVAEVRADDKTILLFRVAVSLDGKPHEPFAGSLADDNVGVAIGTFETGGRVRHPPIN